MILFLALLVSPSTASLADTMQKIASSVRAAVPPADNSLAINAMTNEGLSEADDQVGSATGQTLLQRIVETLVNSRLDILFYTGGCHRNYTSGCPLGWTEDPETRLCTPASDTGSPECASFDLNRIEAAPKFAVKCKAQWPCVSCLRDFTACPYHWEPVDDEKSTCQPMREYVGPCKEKVLFSKTNFPTNLDKAKWAAICYAEWPCHLY